MKRAVPYPLLTLALLSMWLMLNDSTAPDQVLLGLLVGLLGGLAYARIAPSRGTVGNALVPVAALAWLVLVDIVRSNLAVLRIAAGMGGRRRVAGFLSIPLDLRDRRGLAVLACIVTATPGTAWAHHEAAANILTLHVLDLVDEAAWVRQFKNRYERCLMEIFP